MLVLGIIYCFFGYRYFKIIIVAYALLGGAYFMNTFILQIAPQLADYIWLISIATGCVLALLAFFFVKFAIFIAGGMLGLLVYNIIKGISPELFAGNENATNILIGIAFFVIAGVITLALKKHIIIIVSAIFGAYSLVFCAGILMGLFGHTELISQATMQNATTVFAPASIFNDKPYYVMVIPIVIFAILGIVSQYKVSRPARAAGGRHMYKNS